MSISGWSLDEMDDMIWNEFHQNKDHIVPDPSDAKGSMWTTSEKQWKKLHCQNSNTFLKSTEQKMLGINNVIFEGKASGLSGSDSKGDLSAQSLNVDTWVVLDDEELPTAAYSRMHEDSDMGIGSQNGVNVDYGKDDLIQEYCKEDSLLAERGTAVSNNSCDFLMNNISQSEGDLDFLEGDHRSETSNGLLEYSWENIGNFEEVEKLFRNTDSALSEAMDSSSDELIWHTASFVSTNTSHPRSIQQGMDSSNPELRQRERSQNNDLKVKMEGVPCDNSSSFVFNQKDDPKIKYVQHNDQPSGPDRPLKKSSAIHMLPSEGHTSGTLLEEQQPKNSRRLEQAIGPQSKCPSEQMNVTYQYTNKVDSKLMQTIANELDKKVQMKFPDNEVALNSQKVPYIHAGYEYPLHCLLTVPSSSSSMPSGCQSQPYFSAYQLPADTLNQCQHTKRTFDMLSGPSIMTPQDKIEKLRWRPQVYDKIGADNKKQNTSMDHLMSNKHLQEIHYQLADVKPKEGADRISETSNGKPDKQDDTSADCGSIFDSEDCSVEAAMLCQLQTSVTKLDMRTRLNIRDALYRLARSAMQRRCVCDVNCNSIIKGEDMGTCLTKTSSMEAERCAGITNFETETNVVDRIVAHLLFHRSATSSAGGSLTVKEAPGELTSSVNPPSLPQVSCCCSWNPSALHTSSLLGANPLVPIQASLAGQVVTPMPDSCIGASNQGITNIMQGSSSFTRACNTSSLVFHPHIRGALDARDLLNTGIETMSRHQDAPHNNNYAADVKCNPLTKANTSMENDKGLHFHCMITTDISQPDNGNQTKQESLETMDIDICHTDADVLVSEESSKAGLNKDFHAGYMEIENTEHPVHPISSSVRTMLVH